MEIIKGYNYLSISKWFEEKEVEAIRAHIPVKVIDDSICILKLDDFKSFLFKNQIQQVFVYEQYVEPKEYMITEETFIALGLNRESLEYLEESIEEYNYMLSIIDEFDYPKKIAILCIWNGQRFYYLHQNEMFLEGEFLLSAKETLSEMIRDYERSMEEKLIETQKNQLRLQIIKDPKFRECTNCRMRRNYIKEIVLTDTVPEELKSVWLDGNFLNRGAYDFIQAIWIEYKRQRI